MQEPKKKNQEMGEPAEKDKGFNASHGYGPGHGGPSGPGDAPSPPQNPDTLVIPADEDEDDE